jgi:hypothetical protein
MQELINRLTEKTGITADQAAKSIDVTKDFVKEKFPMMADAVNKLFSEPTAEAAQPATPETPKAEGTSIMDKISDVIPGQTGEKVEEFVKNAEHKVEEVFGSLKDKIGGFFGGDKK